MTREYVKVPLHGNTPSAQITPPQGSLRVVVLSPPHYTPIMPIPNVVPSSRLARWHYIALPFSWLTIASQRQKTMKWPKKFVRISKIIL